MNRILLSSTESSDAAPQSQHALFTGQVVRGKDPFPYALFGPMHYESNYAYPLIIWLHGRRDNEQQLKRVMPLISLRNFVAVAPRGVPLASSPRLAKDACNWPRKHPRLLSLAEERVAAAIEAAQARYHIQSDRIFLAGFDRGGEMAFRLAVREPEKYAGVISLCGAFPRQGRPMSRLNDLRRVPVFIASGKDSHVYSPQQVSQDLRLLHSAGMNVTLRIYPCQQQLMSHMLADVNRWVMEQIEETEE